MSELWRPVSGYEGLYEVSDHGRVRSLDRVCIYCRVDQYSGRELTVHRHIKGKLLRPGRMTAGHMSVSLGRHNSIPVHTLVLTAFLGLRPEGMEACHNNGNPSDNRLPNLRWDTRSSNLHDAVRHGTKPIGERSWNAKLRNADIPKIRALIGSALDALSHEIEALNEGAS